VVSETKVQGRIRSALQPRIWGESAGAPGVSLLSAKGISSGEAEGQQQEKEEVLGGAFFWLTAFYFVYCMRPADLIPALTVVPLAKISGLLTTLSLLLSIGKTRRGLGDLPREAYYLMFMMALLSVSAVVSPVWKGGAVAVVLDFSKALVAWVLTFLLVTTVRRLRRIIFIQSAAVALITGIAVVKGHAVPRLQDVIGGFYSNPNDMAFAIVLSIPFCLAFLLSARSVPRKMAWGLAIVVMATALILTASRAAFINLIIAGTVLLWQFGVKGKRPKLIVGAILLCLSLMLLAGRDLAVRLSGIFTGGDSTEQNIAHESYEQRRQLNFKALSAIARYPLFGIGAGDFEMYSGIWREVHNAYLQIAVEGGIPVLILYLLFFGRGFANLRALGQTKNLDDETVLFVGALKSSLVGFVVGACFAPEAYQYFPYFAVCYTSVLLAMAKERANSQLPAARLSTSRLRYAAKAY
jgi:O-antigen ligase